MKVLFIVSKDGRDPSAAGGEIHLFALAKLLSHKGHSVTYVCREPAEGGDKSQLGCLRIVNLKQSFFSLRVFFFYMKRARGRYAVVVEQVFGGFRLPFLCCLYVKEPLIAFWYQRHTRMFFAQFLWPIAALLSALESFLALLYRKKTVVTDSHDQKDGLAALGIPREKISVLPPAGFFFNVKLKDEKRKNDLGREQFPLLVTLGNLRKYKSFHHAILAANVLVKKHPNLQLIIAGKRADVKYEHALHRLADELSLQRNVSIEVNVTEARKHELLENALALIVPSPVEGFGMVTLEAGALSTCSIVSDGVPHDAVINGYNGLRYKFGDIEGLVQALDRLLTNRQLRKKLSQNAARHSGEFSWQKAVDDFEKLLMKTIESS